MTLHHFSQPTDGSAPYGVLIQATDGAIYGTNAYGGANGWGTIFRWDEGSGVTTVHHFSKTDGAHPFGGLVEGSAGALYGTTYAYGAGGRGTIFRWQQGAGFTTLHSFNPSNEGGNPSGVIAGPDEALYGTTYFGAGSPYGAVFRWTQTTGMTVLHRFSQADGAFPHWGVIESRDGTTLYGSTYRGGQTSGFSLLHSFDWGIDGSLPFGGVMQASDGAFYGTTCSGGQHGGGTIYRWNGALTVLHAFSEDVDGFCPAFNGIIEGSDGAFDGTTYWGESAVPDAAGTLWVHLFSGSDGSWPSGWLVRGPDGALYGTTSEGGPGGVGVLFRRPTYLPGGMCLGEPGHAILPPIRADGMSVFRQGASVPAKFRVCDASGQSVGTPGVVTSFRLVGTIVGTTVTAMDEPVPSTTGQSEFRWEAGAQQWIFNISTRTLAADTTYLFRIELDDGSAIDFRFALR